MLSSTPGLAHQPVGPDAEEDHECREDHQIGHVAILAQHGEADRFHHAEDEAAGDGTAYHAGAADHDHHEGLDGDRAADPRIDAGNGGEETADDPRQHGAE